MHHRFQRRQPKALVQRRKDEHFRFVIENPQHFDRDESQKAHIILHAAPHHGSTQVGIAGKIVSDNDQLEIRIRLISF